jgi:hypothetical protein
MRTRRLVGWQRRGRSGAVVAIGMLLLAAAGTGRAPASTQRASSSGPGGAQAAARWMSADTQALMLAQVPLTDAVERIRAAATGTGSGFAGIRLSVTAHTLVLYWKGAVPASTQRLLAQLRSPKVHIQVAAAPYSNQDLDVRARRILAGRARLAQQGLALSSVGVRSDGTGIDVGVDRSSRMPVSRAASVLAVDVPVRVVFRSRPVPTNRLEDLPLHWAGARMTSDQTPRGCSSGFPVRRNSDGRTFITTAAHCDGGQWWTLLGPRDTAHKFGETWDRVGGIDTQFVRPPNGDVEGRTYDGGVAPGTEFSKPVVGAQHGVEGGYVCTSGSRTGVHCNIKIQYGDVEFINIGGVNYLFHLWWAQQLNGTTATGRGDSGGPVFSLSSDPHKVIARGDSSEGGGSSWTCHSNYSGDPSTTCYDWVGFVDIYDVLGWYPATIMTTS